MKAVIKIVTPQTLEGSWFMRQLHKDVFNAILSQDFIANDFPKKLICSSISLDEVTVQSKHQTVSFTEVNWIHNNLDFKELHIVESTEQSPPEIYDITKNCFSYKGVWGIPGIKTFEMKLNSNLDMRTNFGQIKSLIYETNRILTFYKKISALELLEKFMNYFMISLADIDYLILSDFLEVKDGKIIYVKDINDATTIYSIDTISYSTKEFSIKVLLNQRNMIDNGLSLTVFGRKSIKVADNSFIVNTAMNAINELAQKVEQFNTAR